jgi:hypothetical protein
LGRRKALGTLGSIAFVGITAFGWLGCQASKTTELVAGISTQVQVPRDIKTVQIRVAVEGAETFCRNYAAFEGKVQLPRTLGTLPKSDATAVVTISILGWPAYEADTAGTAGVVAQGLGFTCSTDGAVGHDTTSDGQMTPGARILRRSRQPYSSQEILFVPMPLKYSCFDVDCSPMGSDKTCKAGRCVDSSITTDKLPVYSDDLVFGGDSTCFSVDDGKGGGCFNDAYKLPPITVDDSKCIYRVPNMMDLQNAGIAVPSIPSGVVIPPDALNVRIIYDGGVTNEILDLDADEGFSVPDPTNPQTFQLAPGICDLVHGYNSAQHRVTGIEVNPVCRPKLPSQSICAKDQLAIVGANPDDGTVSDPNATCITTPLAPQKAVAEFVVDPTTDSIDFFTAVGSFAQKLNDPALSNLSVGVHFMELGALQGTTCPTGASPLKDTVKPLAVVDPANPSDITKSPLYMYLAGLVGGDLTNPKAPNLALPARLNVTEGLERAYTDLSTNAPAGSQQSIIVVGKNSTMAGVTTPDLSLSCLDTSVTPNKNQTPAQVVTAHNSAAVSILELGTALAQNDPCTMGAPLASAVGVDSQGNQRCTPTDDSSGKNHTQEQILNAFMEAVACAYQAPAQVPDEVWFQNVDPTVGKVVVKKGTATTATECRASTSSGFYSDSKSLLLCGSSCGDYLKALQSSFAAANATAATSGSATSAFKLPTITPLFAITGSACTPPTMPSSGGNGMMTGTGGGVSCQGAPGNMCSANQVCCPPFNGGTPFCATGTCPPNGGGGDAGADSGTRDGGGVGTDAGANCNPAMCDGCCATDGSGCHPVASDQYCGPINGTCVNCSAQKAGSTCNAQTRTCQVCNANIQMPDDTMGNCTFVDSCPASGHNYSVQCVNGGAMTTCTCYQQGIAGKTFTTAGDQCSNLNGFDLSLNPTTSIPNFLTNAAGCGYPTPL